MSKIRHYRVEVTDKTRPGILGPEQNNFAALELLAREKRKTEALLHAAKVCLMAERERRAALLPGAPATTYCEKRIALIEAAIKEAEGAK